MSAYYDGRWKKYIYWVKKKGIYRFAHIIDSAYGCEKDRVVTKDEENLNIIPQ